MGYKVVAVGTVNEALAAARQETPDLILSDFHLAGEDGCKFLALIKEDPNLKTIPFILTSSVVLSEPCAARRNIARPSTRLLAACHKLGGGRRIASTARRLRQPASLATLA
jgi:CheY-like chemotaxis protein